MNSEVNTFLERITVSIGELCIVTPHILLLEATNSNPTIEEVESYNIMLMNISKKLSSPFVYVIDLSRVNSRVKGQVRMELGIGAKQFEKINAGALKHVFMVISSPLTKLMLRSLTAIVRPDVPQSYATTVEEALSRAQAEIERYQSIDQG